MERRRQGGQDPAVSERMIPLRLADQAVAACEAELQKLRAENAELKKAMFSGGYANVAQVVAADKARQQLNRRVAKRKPATSDALTTKRKPKTPSMTQGWRKMSTAPLGVSIEVRFAGTGADIRHRTVTVTLDDVGFWISKTYWSRFTNHGHDRLDSWRPLSK